MFLSSAFLQHMSISALNKLSHTGQKFSENIFVKVYSSISKYRFLNGIFINMSQSTYCENKLIKLRKKKRILFQGQTKP